MLEASLSAGQVGRMAVHSRLTPGSQLMLCCVSNGNAA